MAASAEPLPPYITTRIPSVVRDMGLTDICDGLTSLGARKILNGRLAIEANAQYDNQLLAISQCDGIVSDELAQKLHVRIASGLVKPKEHAFIVLSSVAEHNPELMHASFAHLKASPARTLAAMREAQRLGLAMLTVSTTGMQGGLQEASAAIVNPLAETDGSGKASHYNRRTAGGLALLDALANYRNINLDELPVYQQTILEPQKALEQHIKEFGGPILSAQQLRNEAPDIIAQRYKREFQNRVFYFDPIAALGCIYNAEPKLKTSKDHLGWYCSAVAIQRFDRALGDTYSLSARGPNQHAAKQAAARIVLQHIGATKIDRD